VEIGLEAVCGFGAEAPLQIERNALWRLKRGILVFGFRSRAVGHDRDPSGSRRDRVATRCPVASVLSCMSVLS
jgi:hypothetical protein